MNKLVRAFAVMVGLSFPMPCRSIDFDGDNDYVEISANLYSTNMTMACWVKWDTQASVETPFESIGSVGTQRAGFATVGASANDLYHFHHDQFRTDLDGISDGTWYHICVVFTASNLELFIDGASADSGTGSNATDSGTLNIARIGRGVVGGFADAQIDDCRIYNRALSAADVEALYRGTRQRARKRTGGSVANGLVGHWEMRGGVIGSAVTTAIDSLGANNGTGSGGASLTYSEPARN